MTWTRKLFVSAFCVSVFQLLLVFGFSPNVSATRDYSSVSSTVPNTVEARLNDNYVNFTTNTTGGGSATFSYYPSAVACSGNTAGFSDFRFSNFRNAFVIPKHSDFTFEFYWKFTSAGSTSLPYQDTFIHLPSRLTIGSSSRYYYLVDHNIDFIKQEDFDTTLTSTSFYTSFTYRNDTDNNITISSANGTTGVITLSWNGFPNICKGSSGTAVSFVWVGGYTEPIMKSSQEIDNEQQQQDEQDRANIESQTDDTQAGADESSAQAQATGTTLMGAFSAFVTALASVHETNCNLPTFSIYGMNFSNMDLCTFDVPSGIIALATIGMVFVIVPLSFHLVRRLINIFRSFSG